MQARFIVPMALSLGFGILFATVISLLLVPCLYLILDDVASAWRRLAPDVAETAVACAGRGRG
jgi:Cu/Ag efflux pump CusA